ncbi:hypothetical protein L1987_32111 [Smallanthus sonchifolius]|uniref:Uncharacterized protein n=1 Tax=Smallanthus sonchifolius TaxID=185202 RepID=A0ACB9I9B4_9ASTR|nr:hypothetical protein L1987_32111 [Smallanthus sonchifolius]
MTTSHPCFSYDVFLSFRGEDTRKTFTDHLYAALKQAGIRTFRDDDAMDRGKLIGLELKKAIRDSAISIIVFSRNYASSKWCLDEVLTIIEEQERLSSKHEVVPLFYDVEPSDVRNQTGSFEEAFGWYDNMIEAESDHQKKIAWMENVKAWRDSLKKAGSLTGMILANGGLPLALKVLGSFLNGKTIDVWEDAIHKLEAVPNPEIQKILQLSYETLEDTKDKELFLHVACFFVGEDKEFIVKLLAECDLYPIVGIKNLMDRCLLYIENGRVMMHPLIKEMGQEVVRQESPKDPGKRSRLWHHQDALNVLKENDGTSKVEGLILDMQRIKGISPTSMVRMNNGIKRSYDDFSGRTICANKENFKVGAIEKMKNLMLLQVDYATFSGNYKKLPKKLRLLRWHGFNLKSIPSDVPLQKLVVLDLRYSKLKKVWDGFKVVGSLKILNLSHSVDLIKTPDFGGLPNLESLLLSGCLSLTQVCESIGYLNRLGLLDISDCISLKDIPGLPRSLKSLKMYGCPNIGGLGQLQCLDSCSLSSLLVNIDVSGCSLFNNSFPEDWSNLSSLIFLDISNNHITSLPGCVKSLPSLEKLYARRCSHLRSVLDVPNTVTYLNTTMNLSLEKVQPTPNTTFLSFYGCEKLCAVEDCFKLESIKQIDRRILRHLGLELISEKGTGFRLDDKLYTEEFSIKISYELGIFSTYVLGKTLPHFRYKETGSKISFRVPSHPSGSRTSGLNIGGATDVPNIDGISDLIVDWWGLRENWRCKHIDAGVPGAI